MIVHKAGRVLSPEPAHVGSLNLDFPGSEFSVGEATWSVRFCYRRSWLSRVREAETILGTSCVLSPFGRVPLFAAPWTVAHQMLCLWDSPGKNTEGV